ncbi:MAG: DUF3352 domain-containing protein [Calothrix sp. MO_167.B12]|nr:DUF3352 domain-containing protein [Calothrix sp. MO_167.B12]
MTEKKSKFLIPALGLGAIVLGSIAAYIYLKGPSGDASGAWESAKIVPDEALMATYITTDPQAWAKLEKFGTPEARQLLGKGLEDFNQNMLKQGGISYEQDLKPWVGGVMLAVLPPSSGTEAQLRAPSSPKKVSRRRTSEPNILLVVGIKDKLAALNFANKLKSQKEVKSQEIEYKGEKIIETTNKGSSTYTAVLNNTYVVFAPNQKPIEYAIDTFKGEPSFTTKEGAKDLLAKGAKLQNTVAQIYLPDYASSIQQLVASNPRTAQLPPQTLAQLKQVKSMVAGVGIDDAGVRMKAIATLDPQLTKFQYKNTPGKIISRFPGDTIALISGEGINRWWSAMVEQSKDYPEFNQAVNLVRSQLQQFNIDLDKDIFSWMNGEFGIAAIPANQGLLAEVGFGGAFVFNTSDRKTAESTLSKLDKIVQQQPVNVAQTNVGGKNVTQWQVPGQGALLSHGWLDSNTVFLAIGNSVAESVASDQGKSLDQSENFKTITGSLAQPNGGYFYLDMNKTLSLINRFATRRQPIPPEANAILGSIHGVGMAANSPNKSTSEVELLLALKTK